MIHVVANEIGRRWFGQRPRHIRIHGRCRLRASGREIPVVIPEPGAYRQLPRLTAVTVRSRASLSFLSVHRLVSGPQQAVQAEGGTRGAGGDTDADSKRVRS